MEWSLHPQDRAAAHRLRHHIMACLTRLAAPGSDLSAAEIVVGELLSNAIAHTHSAAWVTLRWDGVHPLLSVADLGPGFGPAAHGGRHSVPDRGLRPRLPDDLLADGGRGLYLVSRLALDLAVAPRATGGSVVSVTLDLTRAADPATTSTAATPHG